MILAQINDLLLIQVIIRSIWHLLKISVVLSLYLIPGVPEKAERWIFSTLRTESVAYVYMYIIR